MAIYATLEDLGKAFRTGQFGSEGQKIRIEDDDKNEKLIRVTCAEESEGVYELMFEGEVEGGYEAVVKALGSSFKAGD